MGLLAGRRALVVGVANKRSLAWGCVRAFHREGAEIVLSYQSDHFRKNIEGLLKESGISAPLIPLDVADDASLESFGKALVPHGPIDVVVHSVAHAKAEELRGEFVDTSRDGFHLALDVSSYSLVALARTCRPHLAQEASIITMTYQAGERVVPNYNVMAVAKSALETAVRYLASNLGPDGVRVNAISSGPVKTLAASGVKGISDMIRNYEELAPLRRGMTGDDVGDVAVFLASDLARSVTGSVIFSDQGFHVLGVG